MLAGAARTPVRQSRSGRQPDQAGSHLAVKLASTYAPLSIAESLVLGRSNRLAPKPSGQLRCANKERAMYREPGTSVANDDHDILTLAEVAEMTRMEPSTLRWWRFAGEGGPKSFKLGRRIMYRRADVEKWLEAHADGQ
jgi:predicted DNA-binding transcriptional regulator AlpA